MAAREFIPIGVGVLAVSDTRTLATDTSGALLVERLTEAGHDLRDRAIVRDDVDAIQAILHCWIADPEIDAAESCAHHQYQHVQRGATADGQSGQTCVAGQTVAASCRGADSGQDSRVPAHGFPRW